MLFKSLLAKIVPDRQPSVRQCQRTARRRARLERLGDRLMMFGDDIVADPGSSLDLDDARDDLQSYLSGPIVPEFQSNPGATHSLYLDFDGYEYMGVIGNYARPHTDVFSLDDDYKSFSKLERDLIEDVWNWVAEDFAPFDVNVTTVEPSERAFANNLALRVAIGGAGDWFYQPVSGVSLGNPLGDDFTPNVVWTFSEVIQARAEGSSTDGDGRDVLLLPYLSNTISHEAGHAYGLSHNSAFDPETGLRTAIYSGGEELRTSIMGSNRASDRATWDLNERWRVQTDEDGNAIEVEEDVFLWEYWKTVDEMEELADHLGYRADDHGGSLADATNLKREFSSVSGAGIIEQVTDEDWFRFSTSGGNVQLAANVLADMTDLNGDGIDNDLDGDVDEGDEYLWGGANLDLRMELFRVDNEVSGAMTLIAAVDPDDRLGAEYSGTLGSGDYVMVIKSHGHAGDAGQYTLSGSVPKFTIEPIDVPEIWPTNPFVSPNTDPRQVTEPTKADALTVKPTATMADDSIITVDSMTTIDSKAMTDPKADESTSVKNAETIDKALIDLADDPVATLAKAASK